MASFKWWDDGVLFKVVPGHTILGTEGGGMGRILTAAEVFKMGPPEALSREAWEKLGPLMKRHLLEDLRMKTRLLNEGACEMEWRGALC